MNSINTPSSKQIKQLKCNQTIFHTYFLSAAAAVTLSTPDISNSISLPHHPVTIAKVAVKLLAFHSKLCKNI